MKWRLYALVGLLLALLSAFLLGHCSQAGKPTGITNEALTQEEVKAGVKEKITLDTRKKTLTRSRVLKAPAKGVGGATGEQLGGDAGQVETKTEHFERRAVITQDAEGNLHIWAPKSGAILEGGAMFGLRGGSGCVGLDGQLLYYKQWGLNVGVNALLRGRMQPRAYAAISYALPWEAFSNTSLLVGADSSKEVLIGIRVRL